MQGFPTFQCPGSEEKKNRYSFVPQLTKTNQSDKLGCIKKMLLTFSLRSILIE